MRKLIYIANARMPTEKAHGIQIAKMCEAFAGTGAEVDLILPWRVNRMSGDLFRYYGVKRSFAVRRFFTLDMLWLPFLKPLWFFLQTVSFVKIVWLASRVRSREWRASIVYTRELLVTAFPPRAKELIFEIHRLPKKNTWIWRRALARVDRLVVISDGLKEDLLAFGVQPEKIMVALDAVDLAQFDITVSQKEAREKLDLPLDRQIVMYTGHLYDWKGAETLLAAASMCPDKRFIFVGGTKEDRKAFEIKAKGMTHVLVLGHRSPDMIPLYLKAADILVIPNSGKEVVSARYTSPMKLFEYMAARRPIIASDLPSIRETLDDSTATFFAPDNAQSLTNAIQFVFMHAEESAQKADRAFEKVKECTWSKRAQKILHLCAA